MSLPWYRFDRDIPEARWLPSLLTHSLIHAEAHAKQRKYFVGAFLVLFTLLTAYALLVAGTITLLGLPQAIIGGVIGGSVAGGMNLVLPRIMKRARRLAAWSTLRKTALTWDLASLPAPDLAQSFVWEIAGKKWALTLLGEKGAEEFLVLAQNSEKSAGELADVVRMLRQV